MILLTRGILHPPGTRHLACAPPLRLMMLSSLYSPLPQGERQVSLSPSLGEESQGLGTRDRLRQGARELLRPAREEPGVIHNRIYSANQYTRESLVTFGIRAEFLS